MHTCVYPSCAHVHENAGIYAHRFLLTRDSPETSRCPCLDLPVPLPQKEPLDTAPSQTTAAHMFPELFQSEKNHLNNCKSPRTRTQGTPIWSLKMTQPGHQKRPPPPAKSGYCPSLLWPRSGARAKEAQCARLRASTAVGGTRHDPSASSWGPPHVLAFCEHAVVPASGPSL